MSISVIIPAYNAAAFLAESIETALRQTLPPDEIIVTDDGSTDETAAIAEGFGTSVRVVRQANGGLSAARNAAVAQATSEWLAFLDADDLWAPDKLERQMKELAAHPEADLCYTGRISFRDKDGHRTFTTPRPAPPTERIASKLLRGMVFLPSCVVMRRSVYLAHGGFAEDIPMNNDWDFWLRLNTAGVRFAAVPELLLIYRLHGNNMSKDTIASGAECVLIFQRRVLPQLSAPYKWIVMAEFYSAIDANRAYAMRLGGDTRCLSVMAQSLLLWPFNDPFRYKVMPHMVISRFLPGLLPKRRS